MKREDERELIKGVIKNHMGMLKAIHTYYASLSDYPYMSEFEYTNFLKKLAISDSNLFKGIEMKAVHQKQIECVKDGSLLRFQFLEIIVRLSNYFNKKNASAGLSESEALAAFLEQDVASNC